MIGTWLPGPDAHEHQFVEEQEPSGRLVLAPCLVCGMSGGDAIAIASGRLLQINGFIDMLEEADSDPYDEETIAWVREWLTLLLDGATVRDVLGLGEADAL